MSYSARIVLLALLGLGVLALLSARPAPNADIESVANTYLIGRKVEVQTNPATEVVADQGKFLAGKLEVMNSSGLLVMSSNERVWIPMANVLYVRAN